MKFTANLSSLAITVGYFDKDEVVMKMDTRDGIVKGQWADLPVQIMMALNFK